MSFACSQHAKTPATTTSDSRNSAAIRDTPQTDTEAPEVRESLEWLAKADPDSDARRGIRAGNIYFMGMMGFAMDVPGVDDYYERYAESSGSKVPVKIIIGTTDAVFTDDEARLEELALKYATRFNTIILKHLKHRKTTVSHN